MVRVLPTEALFWGGFAEFGRARATHTHTHTQMKGVSEPRIRFFAGKHVGCAPFAHLLGRKRALTSITNKNTRF